jgi:hypothetical protein
MIAAGTLKGTVRFYGTPAEETLGGKIYMIREGLFKDVDIALAWHPEDKTTVDNLGAQAIVQFMVEFVGGRHAPPTTECAQRLGRGGGLYPRDQPASRTRATDRADALHGRARR